MSLAISDVQPDQLTATELSYSLRNQVHSAIANHTEFRRERIVTQDNRVKYSATEQKGNSSDHLGEVFHLMRELNENGISSDKIGRLAQNGRSFRKALERICSQIATQANGNPITYVELGPEPVKTSFILKNLQKAGVTINQYIAVDINPKSTDPMRSALGKVLPGTSLSFVTTSFEEFDLQEYIGKSETPALVTMLGFQEGNDDPFKINEWLRNIAREGDFLLSESQLHVTGQIDKIANFYAHPAMQRFSRISFEQAIDPAVPTLNRFFLLPVTFQDGQTAQVAILAEEFATTTDERNLHVSNFCLKLQLDQYRHYRKIGGYFDIIGETITDDKTLHFQLSRRNPD